MLAGNMGRTMFCSPYSEAMNSNLHRAAAKPIPLLIIRTHAADTRAEALRDHGGKHGVAERRHA